MTLREFLNAKSKEEVERLASRCGTSVGMLRQIAYGHRRAREALAINLERETSGEIVCEMLRPDVDWKFIRNSATA